MSESCPCGSGKDYITCCETLHTGKAKALSAEQLMRSRYSAFVKNQVDYIVATTIEAERKKLDIGELENWARESQWNGLEIVSTANGLENDSQGIVEFKAKYQVGNNEVVHHERSDFQKVDGVWFYGDGKILRSNSVRLGPKLGRNDPCSCGSGKKYKKCCLQ